MFSAYVAAARSRGPSSSSTSSGRIDAGRRRGGIGSPTGKAGSGASRPAARLLDAGRDTATFRDPTTGQLLRSRVIDVLALGTR